MRHRWFAAAALGAVVVGGCVSTDQGLLATQARPNTVPPPSTTQVPDTGSTRPPAVPVASIPFTTEVGGTSGGSDGGVDASIPVRDDVVNFGDDKPIREYDGFLTAAVADINIFWEEEFETLYGKGFQPLAGGIHAAYPSRRERIPGCGRAETRFRDVRGNAFYCSDGDFVVYDDEDLMPGLVENMGRSAAAVVIAHEYGHAVQARADELLQPTILKEQQADCFAGAWTARAARGEVEAFQFSDRDVRSGMVAMIQVADPVETSGSIGQDAHGTGFDRVGAFQDGFVGGAERCKPFFTENRQLVDVPFDFGDANQGNLPLTDPTGQGSDVVTLIPGDLVRFWNAQMAARGVTFTAPTLRLYDASGELPECAGVDPSTYKNNVFFCEPTNEVMADEAYARRQIRNVGDMGIGYLIAIAYNEAAQQALGSSLSGEARALANDCLTGVWSKDLLPPPPTRRGTTTTTVPATSEQPLPVRLSAGDLDEAVIAALQRSDVSTDTNVMGSAFEKIAAFRDGVLSGAAACPVLNG